MRLLLDEHLSAHIAQSLRASGFDVASVEEQGLIGTEDRQLWERAIIEGRVIVTYNRDDFLRLFDLFFQESINHPGLVIISSKTVPQHDQGALLRALQQLLETDPDLTDQMIFLKRASSP